MAFFGEMPLPIQFFLAFLIVLGLIGIAAWAVSRFSGGRLGAMGARGRQPRLAVIDHASVDTRRRLVLVRRDNVEHLLMIGGPTDVVVEANIMRGREAATARPTATDPVPRAIALPENGSWPLQPESVVPPPPRQAPRIEPLPEEPMSPPLQSTEAPTRAPRESLNTLADEIVARPVPPPRSRPSGPTRLLAVEPRVEPRAPSPSVQPLDPESAAAADQTLAEMAQRLEQALRKPKPASEAREPRIAAMPPRAVMPEPLAEPEDAVPPPVPMRAAVRNVEAKPQGADAKPSQSKVLYDSLEQEMASLLGRPAGKN